MGKGLKRTKNQSDWTLDIVVHGHFCCLFGIPDVLAVDDAEFYLHCLNVCVFKGISCTFLICRFNEPKPSEISSIPSHQVLS